MNTATSEMLIDIDGEADLAGAVEGGLQRRLALSRIWRTIFSIMTMASSTTKPTEIVSAINEKLSSE